MAIRYPGSNMQELNLDWVLATVRKTVDDVKNGLTDMGGLKKLIESTAYSINNMTVESETLNPEDQASVTKSIVNGCINLLFGIPKGEKGDPGENATDLQVETAVNTWLSANVDPDSGYVLDSSLTQALAAAPADVVGYIRSSIASEFSSSINYQNGYFVYYNNNLYRFTADHPAGAWTGTDVAVTSVGTRLRLLKNDITDILNAIAVEFDANADYDPYTIVWYSNELYILPEGHLAPDSWADTNYDLINIAGVLTALITNLEGLTSNFMDFVAHYQVFELSSYTVDQGFISGTIAASGAIDTSTNTRIRTNQYCGMKVQPGDFFYCDNLYKIRVAIYNSSTMQTSNFVTFLNAFKSGTVYIPDTYFGKYACVLIEKTGYESSNISADVATIGDHVFYHSPATVNSAMRLMETNINRYTLKNYTRPYNQTISGTSSGVTFTENSDGSFTVNGTASATVFKTIRQDRRTIAPFEEGKVYRAVIDGNKSGNVYLRVYGIVGATVQSSSLVSTTSTAYFTFPSGLNGYSIRLYVLNGNTADATVIPNITIEQVPEKLVFAHKIAFFGDSITLGANGSSGLEGLRTPYKIPQTVADRLGIVCHNYGVSTQGYVTLGSDGQNAYSKIASVSLTTYTDVVICYGVNDGFQPIGNYNSSDESEVMGQFNKIINYLGTDYPNIRVIVVAPFNGRNAGSFPDYWYGTPGGSAYSRGTLSNTLKQACEYYNIPYIEQKNSPINAYSIQTLIGTDGVHPCNAGYQALGGWLSGEISKLIG